MNWFERHINWTMVIVWFVIPLAWAAAAIPIMIAYGETSIATAVLAIILLIISFLCLFTAIWGVNKKGRDGRWVLAFFIPYIGWIVLLALKNKNYV
jgi:hypothetical protein